jgi:Tuberculosis necrotizing toxin
VFSQRLNTTAPVLWGEIGRLERTGTFTSPINTSPYNYSQRALKAAEKENALYYEIEILQDIPFKGETADIIPWFGYSGKGKQTKFDIPIDPSTGRPTTWNILARQGLVKITIKKSPNGFYNNFINSIID